MSKATSSTGEIIAFGKYAGMKWADVPLNYLQWLDKKLGAPGNHFQYGSRVIRDRLDEELTRRYFADRKLCTTNAPTVKEQSTE